MRTLGLLLCLVACTLENPAFHASQTDGATTAASTSSATATDPTRPTTGEPTTSTSTSTSTSGPDATSIPGATTDIATTMNVSDTDPPPATTSTSSTTDPPPMTASSDPGDTSTGGPNMCQAFADPPGPFLQIESLPDFLLIPTAVCSMYQQIDLGGRLMADGAGFFLMKDALCMPNNLPVPGLRFPVELPPGVAGSGACVTLKFFVHPQYPTCTISSFRVTHEADPVLWGSFGAYPFPANDPFQIALGAKEVCICPDCCGVDAPDPDQYKFGVNGTYIGEFAPQSIMVDGGSYFFNTLRAHVHQPECLNPGPKADWLHFDFVVARTP